MDWLRMQIKGWWSWCDSTCYHCRQDWSDFLQRHAMAYNTSMQASVGYEPFFLMYGIHAATAVENILPTPVAIMGETGCGKTRASTTELERSQQRQERVYDRCHKNVEYKVNNWFLIEDLTPLLGLSTKLQPLFKGPTKVVGVSADDLNCICEYHHVQGQHNQATYQVCNIKKYEVCHPLRRTIRKTTDGHTVRQ